MELEYDIDNRDENTTRLWIKEKGIKTDRKRHGYIGHIDVELKELVENAKENNPRMGDKNMTWTDGDRAYARFIVEANDERWYRFIGHVLVAGMNLNINMETVMEYILETFHGMDIETEVPLTYEKVLEDMKLI